MDSLSMDALVGMTIKQLQQLCRAGGYGGYRKLKRKADLVLQILHWQQQEQQQEEHQTAAVAADETTVLPAAEGGDIGYVLQPSAPLCTADSEADGGALQQGKQQQLMFQGQAEEAAFNEQPCHPLEPEGLELWEQAAAAKATASAYGLTACNSAGAAAADAAADEHDGAWRIAAALPGWSKPEFDRPGSPEAADPGEVSRAAAASPSNGDCPSSIGDCSFTTGTMAGSERADSFSSMPLPDAATAVAVSAPAVLPTDPQSEHWQSQPLQVSHGAEEAGVALGAAASVHAAVQEVESPGAGERHGHHHHHHHHRRRSGSSSEPSTHGRGPTSPPGRHGQDHHHHRSSRQHTAREGSRGPMQNAGAQRAMRGGGGFAQGPGALQHGHAASGGAQNRPAPRTHGPRTPSPSPIFGAPALATRLQPAPARSAPHALAAAAASGAVAAAVVAAAGGGPSFTGLTERRPLAEFAKIEDIAKGFSQCSWWERRIMDVFSGGRPCGSRELLLRRLPTTPGIYLWLVRAPHTRPWVPVYLGAADNLSERFEAYLHSDGSFGPVTDLRKLRAMVDMQRRNFSIQVRFRPVKSSYKDASQDQISKLRLFDFPLNSEFTGLIRAVEMPSGKQVCEHPVVNLLMTDVFIQLQQRM